MREVSCQKLINPHFVTVLVFVSFNYLLYVYFYMLTLQPSYQLLALVMFHICFVMLLWSMVKAIMSEPGRVPIYWGFFLDEKETKKRRYCLLCHSFKPERCHHCSTCQRCVLNMDHHCPWISNCVGYMNRKFFMLFLFYIICTIVVALIFMTPLLIQEIANIIKNPHYLLGLPIIRILGYAFLVTFGVIITFFFKFHVELILQNSSTIDNLEKSRNPTAASLPNVFDVGAYENWLQVFGSNIIMWPFPMFGESGKPKGDGVEWRKNERSIQV